MTEQWSVDPARVLGVLTLVDDQGNVLETAAASFDTAHSEGVAPFSVDGRTTLSNAWDSFCAERTDVPRKFMSLLADYSGRITEASLAIMAGDAEMAATTKSAQSQALTEWGIDTPSVYDRNTFLGY